MEFNKLENSQNSQVTTKEPSNTQDLEDSLSGESDVSQNQTQENEQDSQLDLPQPWGTVDRDALPPGQVGTYEFEVGAQSGSDALNASDFRNSVLFYEESRSHCYQVLSRYMTLNGGGASLQQYADFIAGCEAVLNLWLSEQN